MPDQTNSTPPSDGGVPHDTTGAHPPGRDANNVDRMRSGEPHRASVSRFWLIPALTFLVGLLLGAAVVGLSRTGNGTELGDGPTQTPIPTVTALAPSPGTRTPATVTVPGACLDMADSTEQLLALVRRAAEAARDLDASQLSSVVRELQDSQTRLQQQANSCRDAASTAVASPTGT